MRQWRRFNKAMWGLTLVALFVFGGVSLTAGTAQAISAAAPQCRHQFDGPEQQRLLELADPATLLDLHDAQNRATEIRALFTKYDDYRGTFAIFYKAVLDGAVPSIDRGDYQDREYVTAVSFDFFQRYLTNLHGHLTGGPVTESWKNFYDMTADCTKSPGRVLLAALNAHVIIDLPRSVAAAGSTPADFADYLLVGDRLQEATPIMFADFGRVYGQDVSSFFGGSIFGDAFDLLAGQDSAQYTALQSARVYAFANGLELQTPTAALAEARMRASWFAAEAFVGSSAAAGLV